MSQTRQKALTERLFLVDLKEKSKDELEREFDVMGSTGNVYKVVIKKNSSCKCPDFLFRKNICKHLYFVYLKVLKAKGDFPKVLKKAQLENLFFNLENITNNLYANEQYREAYIDKIKNEAKTNTQNNLGLKEQKIDDSCPICMEDFEPEVEELDFCKYGCGKSVHKNCFKMWTKKNAGNCVFCRTEWEIVENKRKKGNGYGNYINLYEEVNQPKPKRTHEALEENQANSEEDMNNIDAQHEIENYAEELVKPHSDHQEAVSAFDYYKSLEFYNILSEGEAKTKSEIINETEERWNNLNKKKKKAFEVRLSKQREKVEKEIKDKFLKLKRNYSKEDEEAEKPKSTKKRKK